jgi:hypothetical protein
MRQSLIATSLVLVAAIACGSAAEEPAKPPLTQRQRDSVIGASSLPGAGGVRGAMAQSDSQRRRNARLDSIARDTTG